MTEAEAWRRWRKEDKAAAAYKRSLEKIRKEIQWLGDCIQDSNVETVYAVLTTDKAARKALANFTGRTEYGWSVACGCDGRLMRLPRPLGWDMFYTVVRRARKDLGFTR